MAARMGTGAEDEFGKRRLWRGGRQADDLDGKVRDHFPDRDHDGVRDGPNDSITQKKSHWTCILERPSSSQEQTGTNNTPNTEGK